MRDINKNQKYSATMNNKDSTVLVKWYDMGCYLLTDLEWKIIYVGAAESEEYDQTLDSVLVGPVPAGKHMFVFQVKYTL